MKRAALITLIAIATLCLGVLATYFLLFTPSAHAQRTADRIMQSAYTQDDAAFQSYADPASSELYSAASQRNYRFISLTQEDATFHALYTFTDAQKPSHARITIKNRAVSDMNVGSPLGATPRDDPVKKIIDNTEAGVCLNKDDLAPLDSSHLYARIIRGATMIFGNETDIEYIDAKQSSDILNRMSQFYNNAKDKDFSFLVRGYLPTSSEETELQRQVVSNRTIKIQQDLVDRDISHDRINIGQPIAYDSSVANKTNNTRYVVIDIVNNCID